MRLSILVLLLLPVGCSPTTTRVERSDRPPEEKKMPDAQKEPAAYDVFDGEELVIQIVDQPGKIISRAPPPPGPFTPPDHPFLSLVSVSPFHEARLSRPLALSKSTADFLDRLRQLGLRVVKTR